MLHEVPLAFQKDLVHPGDPKAIPEARKTGIHGRGGQLCPHRKPGPAIHRDQEIHLTAGAVAQLVKLRAKPLAIMKEVAELQQVQGNQVLEARGRGGHKA